MAHRLIRRPPQGSLTVIRVDRRQGIDRTEPQGDPGLPEMQKFAHPFFRPEDAQADGAVLLEPTTDTVTYTDGMTEEVYGFDIPVPYLDEEFDCALIGTKGVWYDHKVSVTNPVPALADGEYTCEVTLAGGSGKASVESPAKITVSGGQAVATVIWSSPHYEYMTIGETQYDPVNTEGNSTFEIPVALDEDMAVSALTTAMSEPHLIDYTLHFDGATLTPAN